MDDPAQPDVRDLFGHAWESAQRLAIEVIGYSIDQRDEVMQRKGGLLAEMALEAG